METPKTDLSTIMEQSPMQEQPVGPAKEHALKKIGKRILGIVLFVVIASILAYIIFNLRIGSTH